MSTKDFKQFLEESASVEAKKTINSLPIKYKNLLKDYIFRFDSGTTLKDDNKHIGVVKKENNKKEIRIASGWFFPREFVLLHEIGHVIYANFVGNNSTKLALWEKLYKKYKKNKSENQEEIFCHNFANYYSNNPLSKFEKNINNFSDFFKDLEKSSS